MDFKKEFKEIKSKLREDMYKLISEFSEETGVAVTNIISDNSYGLLTFKIYTDIDVNGEE